MMLAYLFFVLMIVTGHVVLKALLIALLLKNFEQSIQEDAEQQDEVIRQAIDEDSSSE